MKTAISLPDALYEDAERTAKTLGIPRSQLFARALQEFIAHHEKQGITNKLNKVYGKDSVGEALVRPGLEKLRELTKNDTW